MRHTAPITERDAHALAVKCAPYLRAIAEARSGKERLTTDDVRDALASVDEPGDTQRAMRAILNAFLALP